MQDANNVTNEFIFNYLVKINDKVDLMSTDISTLKTDVSVLATDVSTLKTDVSVLATDVSTLKTDVSTLKIDVSALKTDVSEVKSVMATKQDVEALAISTAKGFAEVNKNISNLKEKVDDVEKNLIDQVEDLARMTNGALAAKQDKFVYA